MNMMARRDASNAVANAAGVDDGLMGLIAAGDRSAFEQLSGKYGPRITGIARRLLGNAADADEVLQETLIKIWMAAPSWQAGGAARFSTWLRRVVVNACLDRKRRRTFSSLDEADDVEASAAGGFDAVIAAERHAVLADAMAKLPERQRSALSLHYFRELSAPQAAKMLGVSVPTMEALLVRGKRALRDVLILAGSFGITDFL